MTFLGYLGYLIFLCVWVGKTCEPMGAVVKIEISQQGQAIIARHADQAATLTAGLSGALKQGLEETGAHLQADYLRGGDWHTPRHGELPLAARTGALLRSISSALSDPLSGYVGVTAADATPYAAVMLDKGTVTIKPVNAKHLWVPLPDALTAGGSPKISPKAAMALTDAHGHRALKIFRSKAGNLVAFLPGAIRAGEKGGDQFVAGGTHKRGKLKGKIKGELLFVLKDEVQVQGTDALAKAVADKTPRMTELLNQAITAATG